MPGAMIRYRSCGGVWRESPSEMLYLKQITNKKMASKKKQRQELTRIVEYFISGGAYFWSGYLTFFIIDKGLHASFFWAKSVSTLVGWTVNYLLQRYWVFNNPKLKKHQTEVTGRYAVITLIDFV